MTSRQSYYQKNKKQILAKQAQDRKDNPEKFSERARKQYEKEETSPSHFASAFCKQAKNGARDRGILFTLTREYLYELLIACKGKCSITGVQLTTTRDHPFRASLDRINSKKGYVPGNVQVVAQQVNYAKNRFDDLSSFDAICKSRVKLLRKNK